MRNIIGIRREDLDKKGEKRVAIVPSVVQDMAQKGFNFVVQPAIHPETLTEKRAFTDEEYEEAGAGKSENLEGCQLIFGLKEVKPQNIIPDKTYLFFSHTHKGQIKNRPLLKDMVEKNITLIDYELIEHKEGGRVLTSFTYFAGYAGMIDSLWSLGQRLLNKGIASPFTQITQSNEIGDLNVIRDLFYEVGKEFRSKGTPKEIPPIICCFLGEGKTSTGAQEMYDILPVKQIKLDQLEEVFQSGDRNYVYKLVLGVKDMFRPKEDSSLHGHTFTRKEFSKNYFATPDQFESNLDKVYPYISILMNCIIWSPEFPRLISRGQAEEWYTDTQTLQVIGDITCDPEGAIQFSKETWIDQPVFVYNPKDRSERFGFEGDGIVVMAVTNLPCEFPADASDRFSRELSPF